MSWVGEDRLGNAVLRVRIVPRAAQDELAGVIGDMLKIRLRAPPVEGRANTALTRWLADQLKIPPKQVSIQSGANARVKIICLRGCRVEDAVRRLGLAP